MGSEMCIRDRTISVSLNVAGGESFTKKETEVVFQLVKRDRSHVTIPVVGITTESVGNPFSPINFKPGKHAHLKDLSLVDKFPAPQERPFQLLLSEPYSLCLREMKGGLLMIQHCPLP